VWAVLSRHVLACLGFLALIAAAIALAACAPDAPAAGCAARLAPGDLVITEVFADFQAAGGEPGTDAGKEWFEIYNASGRAIDLSGLVIAHSRLDGARPGSHVIDRGQIAAGQYFTLGSAAPDALPAYVDHGYGGELGALFNTEGGALALRCDGQGDGELDRAVYRDIAPGHARELSGAQPPDYAANDDPAAWCQAIDTEFAPGNFGTPGAANSPCAALPVAGQCDDGGSLRSIVPPAPGQLVIGEILANPANVDGATDATREWFEVANTGDAAFDLNELEVGRIDAPGSPVRSAPCISVAPHGTAVFARSADPVANGGLPAVHATFRFALVDRNGDVQISRGGAMLDAVRWTSVTSGVASQVDPRRLTPTDNDAPASFCDATAAYGDGTNLGSPGAANPVCP
jgi:hypothetical protein